MQQLITRYFILCLTLLSLPAQAQLSGIAVADSLRQVVRESKPDSSRIDLYLKLGEYYLNKPWALKADMDSAFSYATKAGDLSRSLQFARGNVNSELLLAKVFLESKKVNRLRVLLKKMKPDRHKANILERVGEYYNKKPHELKQDLDSAIYYAQLALNLQIQLPDSLTEVTSLLLLLAEIYKDLGDPSNLHKYQQEAIELIKKEADLDLQASLWVRLGGTFPRAGESMSARINHYEKALALYTQLGNKEKEAGTLKMIADMHQHQGYYAQSLGELLEVLRIQKSIRLRELHYTYDLLAHVYARMGNYELALPYAIDAIQNAQATADTSALVIFYFRVGQIYLDLNQHEQALEMHRTILTKLLRERGGGYFRYRFYYLRKMSLSMIALKKPQESLTLIRNFLKNYPPDVLREEILAALCLGEAYMGLKDYKQAETHLTDGLAKATSVEHTGGSANWFDPDTDPMLFHDNLTKLYLVTRQVHKASFHLKKNFPLINKQPDLLELSKWHFHAFKVDSLQGNFSSAIEHYQQYQALKDSVFNARKSNQLIAYQVQYETEKKEQELQLKEKDIKLKEQSIQVLSKEKVLQQEQIKQAKLLRNAIIVGATLLLMLLGLVYNRYRLKQQSNRLLQDQQRKLQTQHEELQTQQDTLQDQQEQIHQKNQALEKLLIEKERLLKEIHHRVKNNLQIVMSLLNSQVASLQDKTALSAIQDSQNRIQAMALIHQKLYQAEGVACIPMKTYVEEVVAHLRDSYALSRYVNFKLLIEPIELDVNLAVPVGLIINEAITNAFKHAFPGERSGEVTVTLLQKTEASFALTLEDDGVGLPNGYDPSQSRSLGMTLIHGFSAQIGGELNIESKQGIKISLIFTDGRQDSVLRESEYIY